MAGSLATINIRFFADLKQFSTQMRNTTRKLKRFGRDLKKTGSNLTVGLTAPLVAMGVASVKVFADFEQGMAKVKAVSGATTSEFKALTENAKKLGSETRYTASEVALLQLNYSKLGFSASEILKVTDATLELALATGEDLANSATVAASTLRGFGLEASEMQRVVDVMALSFSSSALDLEKFKSAMAILAPVAKNAGVSLEQATGYLSVLVDRGVDASTAGTGLRNMFLNLAESGMTWSEAMDEINSSTNKNATALDLFGKRGATVATIMAENQEEANGLAVSYDNAAGSAKGMALIMDDTLQGSIFKMKSAIEGLFISIGKNLKPIVEAVTARISELANSFGKLDAETQQQILKFAGLAAAIGPVLVAVGYLATNVVPGLIGVVGKLGFALKWLFGIMIANPWIAVATAIAAVVIAIVRHNFKMRETVKRYNALEEVRDTAAKSISKERADLVKLLAIAKDEQLSKKIRLDAIRQLNKISPEYLGGLKLETINSKEATDAINLYSEALLKNATAKAAASKLEENQAKAIELELDFHKKKQDFINSNIRRSTEGYVANEIAVQAINDKFTEAKQLKDKGLSQLKNEADLLIDLIKLNEVKNEVVAKGSTPTAPPELKEGRSRATALTGSIVDIDMPELVDPMKALADSSAENLDRIFVNVDALEAKMEGMRMISETISGSIGDAFSYLGNSIVDGLGLAKDGLEGFVGQMLKLGVELISMLVQNAIQSLIVSQATATGNAIAGATASGTATGPAAIFSTPAFIATAIGGVVAAFASIPKFAMGGVMGGNSTFGDKLFAKINSGEMVLNTGQQKNLSSMMQPVGVTSSVALSGDFRINGNDLVLALDRTNQRNSRKR